MKRKFKQWSNNSTNEQPYLASSHRTQKRSRHMTLKVLCPGLAQAKNRAQLL